MSRTLASLAALGALLVAAPAANASHLPPNLGLEVTKVDPATRSVEGIQHCTAPDRAGRLAKFTVAPDIQFDQFHPGAMWGITVGPDGVIRSTNDMPCQVQPQAGRGEPGPGRPPFVPGPGGAPQPGPHPGPHPGPYPGGPGPHPGGPSPQAFQPGAEMPKFDRKFINRVWKFVVEVDSAENGKLEVTIGKILNLPKRFRAQDDELVDEAAIVLLDRKARVYEDGKRVSASKLEDADGNIRVHGKLLNPTKWQDDEDGEKVPTVRAKKVYL
jgi:hypothetical protein